MRELIDSGVEWLGKIPAHWTTSKIAALYTLRNEKVSDYDFEPLSVTMKGIVPQLATAAKSDDHSNRKLVKKGDFVINSRSDRRGSCGISPLDGSVSLINIVMEPRGEMNPQYYNWLFHTEQFADEFYKWGHGIVDDLWTTRWQEMKKILIVAPLPDEQQAIADYLDETCSKIDEIIAEAKASIDEYKELKQSVIFEAVTKGLDKNVEMKDSGVEWIGKIPASWDVLRIKDIGAARNGLTYSPNDQVDSGKGTLVLRSSNVQNGQIVFDDNVYVNKDIPDNLMLDEGDILICSRNGSRRLIGKNAIVPESGKYTFGAFMMVLKPFNDNKKYIHWILNSGVFGYYLPMFFTSTINQLTRENFRNMQIPYCMDVNVQKDIVEYLDKKCELFDSLIAEKESLINDLETYKKSLIYEVVTGKRRVV